MIIQGKYGTYDVRWGDFGTKAEVLLFRDSPYRKWLFGLFTKKNKADWKTVGRRVRTPEDVRKFTPAQLTDWFWEAVIEYEQHVELWNANQIAANLAYNPS